MRGTLQPYWSHSGWKIHPNAQAVEGPISRTGLTCQNLPLRPKMSNQCKKTAGCAGQGPDGIMCLKKFDLLQPAGFLTISDKPGGGYELCRFLSFYLPFSCWSLYVSVKQTAPYVCAPPYVLYVKWFCPFYHERGTNLSSGRSACTTLSVLVSIPDHVSNYQIEGGVAAVVSSERVFQLRRSLKNK